MQEKSVSWLSQYHFFRDPARSAFVDPGLFFAPADGVVLYASVVEPDEAILDVKGRSYSLQEAIRDPFYDRASLVVGIFMTFFDVHVNRVPYSGFLSYREFDPLDTENHPMLDLEQDIMENLRIPHERAGYLHHNQRMVNRIDVPALGIPYYVLQVADYDVDAITPFTLKQNQPCQQGERFSQIRYGSQVDLIVPLSARHRFTALVSPREHVEAGVDPIVAIDEIHPLSQSGQL
ncbi:phosphatidylserine decarboxylase [Amycolatopsis cynarae]|uniref:Phosphatidylserine decarboxylase n=1 Tax=Amycolatopsis cynarae TaxID=2995223 RepID=A0ABY7AV39_9PSEU|nr:phosphatidylserine decarboxylase [Amycolatopsis sp. HUAS 11-8]WAL63850.1 phosphatidylserine decarboxylase [Amycolatopsis sp. HUAS 11-8]